MFYYLYVLRSSKDSRLYIGFTEDLKARKESHDKGLVKATKPRRPVELIFYEAYKNKYDALRRERYFKTTKGKASLNVMLREYLDSVDNKTDAADTETMFRIIQSIPSPKAEPFKLWLARIGYERIEETEDPEKAIQRALATYLKKGTPRTGLICD